MAKVYDQFDASFRNVSAYVLLFEGQPVGRVALKHGPMLLAYVQLWGAEMKRGRAGGGGYDRATAAVEAAACQISPAHFHEDRKLEREVALRLLQAFSPALGGLGWVQRLEGEGFIVANAIA